MILLIAEMYNLMMDCNCSSCNIVFWFSTGLCCLRLGESTYMRNMYLAYVMVHSCVVSVYVGNG